MCTVRLEVDGRTADHIADTSRFHVDPTGFYPTNAYPAAKPARSSCGTMAGGSSV